MCRTASARRSQRGRLTRPAAVRGSKVLAEVDKYAPEWLKSVPKRMSTLLRTSGLPDVLQPFGRTPIQAVDAPDAALADGCARLAALARRCAESYVADREAMGHPLIKQPARAGKGATNHSPVTTK